MSLKLCEIKKVDTTQYVNVGFMILPWHSHIDVVVRELHPTGRWKLVITDGKADLSLECYGCRGGYPGWVHEGVLDVRERPDPPTVEEYINQSPRILWRFS